MSVQVPSNGVLLDRRLRQRSPRPEARASRAGIAGERQRSVRFRHDFALSPKHVYDVYDASVRYLWGNTKNNCTVSNLKTACAAAY